MTFVLVDLVGGILVCLMGVFVMSIASASIDEQIGIKVSGSTSAQIMHVVLGMTKGALLVWLMSMTGLLGG